MANRGDVISLRGDKNILRGDKNILRGIRNPETRMNTGLFGLPKILIYYQ